MTFKEFSSSSRDYLEFVFNAVAVLGLPVKPIKMSCFAKILYSAYSFLTILCFPIGFVFSQLLEIPALTHDLKLLAGVLSFTFMDVLGKKMLLHGKYFKKLIAALIKMAMMFHKRKEIYKMHQAFKSGMMQPNTKRGGGKEVAYVNQANKEILTQVDD